LEPKGRNAFVIGAGRKAWSDVGGINLVTLIITNETANSFGKNGITVDAISPW